MELLEIEQLNAVYIRIRCSESVSRELADHFTFTIPNAQFSPKFKRGVWDGKIRLFNRAKNTIYAGLRHEVERFAARNHYNVVHLTSFAAANFSVVEAEDFVRRLKLPEKFVPHEHQLKAFIDCVRDGRALTISPTSSGKSLIIYMLTMFYRVRTLIIVPTTTLVFQMKGDFKDYGLDVEKYTHCIVSGQEKYTKKPITISTWQSIYKLDEEFFAQFDVIIGDECHLFSAKSLTGIMEKMTRTFLRFGFTGTLDGSKTNQLTLEGLFGRVRQFVTTAELMEKKIVAQLTIKCIVLEHHDVKAMDYQSEIDYLITCEERNRYIKNLALSLKGNTLVLFQFVDRGDHGKVLYDMIKDNGVDTYFVHGGVAGSKRDELRGVIDASKRSITIASYGTYSTGTSIRNINNIIFASPRLTKIGNLQSIGRGLRISETKSEATLFDIADNFMKKTPNNTLRHFYERVRIYAKEKFIYKVYNVRLK